MANPYLDKAVSVEVNFDELKPRSVSGEILKASAINAFNEFGKAPQVQPARFNGARVSGKKLTLTLPAASVVVLEIK